MRTTDHIGNPSNQTNNPVHAAKATSVKACLKGSNFPCTWPEPRDIMMVFHVVIVVSLDEVISRTASPILSVAVIYIHANI